MKVLTAIPLWLALMTGTCLAEVVVEQNPPTLDPPDGIFQFTSTFWPMPLLPRRFQNHCGFFDGHYVCANHCGPNYQVYYCSERSFGCCHIGRGYCTDTGFVQCAPHYFPFN
jgi:hypothetical protein